MKAGQHIAEAAFDPAQLNAIKKAFDDAWERSAPNVSSRAEAVEAGRLRLASIVLSVAKRGILDPKQLTDRSLRLLSYPPPTSSESSASQRRTTQASTFY